MFELFRRCAVSQDHGLSSFPFCHTFYGFVILRPHWVIDIKQPGLIRGSVGMDIANQLPTEPPIIFCGVDTTRLLKENQALYATK